MDLDEMFGGFEQN
jgi:hypothetical protein